MNLYLREIVKEDKYEIENMALEFQNANDEYPFEGVSNLKNVLEKSFEEFFDSLEANKHIDEIYPAYANQTTYVLVDDNNHIYGLVNIRHELKGKLIEIGGHIGYGIRPTERKKGYATLQLRLLLEKLKDLNIKQALITCRENNIGSKKTMEKFIGKSDTLVQSMHEGIMEYRYWIDVDKNLNQEENFMNIDYKLIPITENDYQFIYELKKNAYKKYVEANCGAWDENAQREYFKKFIEFYKNNTYLIQLEEKVIGFYNDEFLENGDYEVGNICIIPEYQGKGIGTKILKDILEKYKDKNIRIQYFKQNPVGKLYERLGFVPNGETKTHYQMIKLATKKLLK